MCWRNLSTGTETIMYSAFRRQLTKIHFIHIHRSVRSMVRCLAIHYTNRLHNLPHRTHTHTYLFLNLTMGRKFYKTLSVLPNQTSQIAFNVIFGVLNHVVHVTSTLLVTFIATMDYSHWWTNGISCAAICWGDACVFKIAEFWNAPCSLVELYRHFTLICCLIHQGN